LISSAAGEPPVAPIGISGASEAGRPRPKKKRSRPAAEAMQASPATSSRMPATSGAPARRSALSCIAPFAQTRLVTPPTSSTAPHTHSRRFCSW
jgi:hypothetical protein